MWAIAVVTTVEVIGADELTNTDFPVRFEAVGAGHATIVIESEPLTGNHTRT